MIFDLELLLFHFKNLHTHDWTHLLSYETYEKWGQSKWLLHMKMYDLQIMSPFCPKP